MKEVSNVLIKNLGHGIKKIIINDPKTYNSLSFSTLNLLLKNSLVFPITQIWFISKFTPLTIFCSSYLLIII